MLALRICDLGVRLAGSELEPRVNQLFEDLAARGVTLRPHCYLGENGSRLKAFRLSPSRFVPQDATRCRLMMEVEGGTPEWCQMLLRHECGHITPISCPRARTGSKSLENVKYTPETYTPRPYSKKLRPALAQLVRTAAFPDLSETFRGLARQPRRIGGKDIADGSRWIRIHPLGDAGGHRQQPP